MSNAVTVLVCDDAAKAAQAQAFLKGSGYQDQNITVEQTAVVSYDARTYDGGLVDIQRNKFVVIGRQP